MPKKAVVIGFSLAPNFSYLPAPAYLKTYADAQPDLAGRVAVTVFQYQIDYEGNTSKIPRELIAEILGEAPDLVGFSCYLWNIDTILAISRDLKALAPDLKILLGGPDVSHRAEALLGAHPSVDYIAIGEGEGTFADLMRCLLDDKDPEGVAGLTWRRQGKVVCERERPPLPDLAAIPSPFLLGLLPLESNSETIIETSRGCPFLCKFCDWQNGQTTRHFPVDRVLSEIAYVLERADGVGFEIADADLFMDLPRAKTFLRGLKPLIAGKDCRFGFQTYLPNIDDEAFALLDDERFRFGAGVQSTNPAVLKKISRFFDKKKVEDAIARKKRLAPRASLEIELIYGLPGDTPQSFRDSLEWALEQKPGGLQTFRAHALPGSALGRDPERFGVTVENGPPYRVLSVDTFSAEEIARAERWLCKLKVLDSDMHIARAIQIMKERLGRSYVDLWDSLIGYVEQEIPELGLHETWQAMYPLDSNYNEVLRVWRNRLNRKGGQGPLHGEVLKALQGIIAAEPRRYSTGFLRSVSA